MKKRIDNTQAREQLALIEKVRREEAEHIIQTSMQKLHIGKYVRKDGLPSQLSLPLTTRYYKQMANAYEELGDWENAEKAWRTLLTIISRRSKEIDRLGEDEDGYSKEINHAMICAYSFLGRFDFECFLIALELETDAALRFYCTRRNIISADVKELQRLEEGTYDMLGISAPPRTYKTALGTRYLAWVIGRHPDESCFFASHTTKMCRKVMGDMLKILNSEQYQRVFPGLSVQSNQEDLWIDVTPKLRDNGYRTLYFAGIDSNMAGVIHCSWLLYCDDLIASVMEASNPDRVANALEKYTGDIRQRRGGPNVRELLIATRFATKDPLSTMEDAKKNDPKCKFIKRPALNELGESNFMYAVNPLTTEHFMEIKSQMSEIAFECVYQQNPLDREGLVFTHLKRYKELPKGKPDIIFCACDVAFSGSDNLSCPVGYQYGNDVYIPDVVFHKEGWQTTEPIVTGFILKHQPLLANFEYNNGGEFYAKDIKSMIQGQSATRIFGKTHLSNKLVRIEQQEPIIQNFYFLDRSMYKPGSMYDRFMNELERFNINGRNKHDDAADSLAMLAEMFRRKESGSSVTVVERKGHRRR